jgi:hypothetical protein
MALSLADIKDLIEFGRERGLQSLTAEGVSIVYGGQATAIDDERPTDMPSSTLPEELRHYSALGKAAFGKR